MRKYLFLFIAAMLSLISNASHGFDLCPACSPETVSQGDKREDKPDYMLDKGRLTVVGLYRLDAETDTGKHDDSAEAERALLAFNYGVTERIKAGLMYGFTAEKLSLQADFLLLPEKQKWPALIVGSGSFRGIASESHPYIIAMKNLENIVKAPVNVSFGFKHKSESWKELGFEPMGNIIVRLYRSLHIMGIFEGEEIDAAIYGSLSERFIVGLRLIDLKTPTLGLVIRL